MAKKRYVIVLGDKTTGGGQVTSAWGRDGPAKADIEGIPVVCVGDYATCARHKGVHRILEQSIPYLGTLGGRHEALEGFYLSCGCPLISSQRLVCYIDESEDDAKIATAASPTSTTEKGIQTASAMSGISTEEARMLAAQQNYDIKTCACGGPHPLKIVGDEVKPIRSYTGKLLSPSWVYKPYGYSINARTLSNSKKIRTWAREAAAYHEVPYEIVAVLLQQENAPNAPEWRKLGQIIERELQTALNILDKATGIPSRISKATGWNKPKKGASGSSGIANMLDKTLQNTIGYTRKHYPSRGAIVPVHKRDIDNKGISGGDVEADLYYMAAHVRQLIDHVVNNGNPCTKGEITFEQVRKVFQAYNGTDNRSIKYADDAMIKLKGAYAGTITLYFYE